MQRSIGYLWILVIILLILNLVLVYGLNLARLTVIETLGEVETTLDKLANEVIVYDINVNQAVPIKTNVPLNQTMEIPINTEIPINQTLPVPLPIGGDEIQLDLPIKIDFPVNTIVPVDFNETIDVDTTVLLNTTVPVKIEIAKTPLAGYLKQAKLEVSQLKNYLLLRRQDTTPEMTDSITPEHEPTTAPALAFAGEVPPVAPAETPTTISTFTQPHESTSVDMSTTTSKNSVPQPEETFTEPEPGLCMHAYWPVWPGTAWTYNSSHTSYIQYADDVANNQISLSSQYEGQNISSSLICYQEGLGGSYLGDMRRITEFGDLRFSDAHGLFLPRPEIMEAVGSSWTQELGITGMVEGHQGDRLVEGNITRGRALATYTPTGFETLATPLGPRKALRIEQQLDLELNINFNLDNLLVPATEVIKLTNVYWIVKGIGPVKVHWQGGTIERNFTLENTPINQLVSVSTLAEELLASVCVLTERGDSECMRLATTASSDLTSPPVSELEVEGFVFPDIIDNNNADTTELINPYEPSQEAVSTDEASKEFPKAEPSPDNDNGRSALLAYAEAVANYGQEITNTGQDFGKSVMAYRKGELTLDEFHEEFLSFATKIKDLIEEINRLSPPVQVETAHKKLTEGLDNCSQAIDLMGQWFESQNDSTKEATILLVTTCMDQVTSAGDEIEALVDDN